MAISKSKAPTKDGNTKNAKPSKATAKASTPHRNVMAKGAETSKSDTPVSKQRQHKKAKEGSCEGTTIDIITEQEDKDKTIQEVYNQDEKDYDAGKKDEEDKAISIDLSIMNKDDKRVTGFITYYWDRIFPKATSALSKLFAATLTVKQVLQLKVIITVSIKISRLVNGRYSEFTTLCSFKYLT